MVKALIFLAIILTGGAFAAWDVIRAPAPRTPTPPLHVSQGAENIEKMHSPAPETVFTDLDGHTYNLADFTGRVVILNFWATWCAPCVVEFPRLLELAALRADDVTFIAVSVDENKKQIEEFLSRLKRENRALAEAANVIIAHDPGKEIAQGAYLSVKYPESFVIGPDQTIRYKVSGVIEWSGAEGLGLVDTLIGR